MIWNSWGEFFAMGGYALYVWGSVAAVFAAIEFEVIELVWRRQSTVAERKERAQP